MGRTIVVQYLTLDGVVEDPDGSDGTPFGGWAMRYGSEGVAGDKFRLASTLETGTLLFGRRTWDHFATRWPQRESLFAQSMNRARKAVITHRPIADDVWANSRAVTESLETWLPTTLASGDVVVIGSGSVITRLAEHDLIDEYRLLAFPIVLGAGRRLFGEIIAGPARQAERGMGIDLELVSVEQVGPGSLSVLRTATRENRSSSRGDRSNLTPPGRRS